MASDSEVLERLESFANWDAGTEVANCARVGVNARICVGANFARHTDRSWEYIGIYQVSVSGRRRSECASGVCSDCK